MCEREGEDILISERKYELVGSKESCGWEEGTMLDKVACTIQWEAMGTVSEDAPWSVTVDKNHRDAPHRNSWHDPCHKVL